MTRKAFGTADEYFRAFSVIQSEGLPEKHRAMLPQALQPKNYTTTWADLAAAVGYPSGGTVNHQYGTLAGRVASLLNVLRAAERSSGSMFSPTGLTTATPTADIPRSSFGAPVIEAALRLGWLP